MGAHDPGALWNLGKTTFLWPPFSLCGIGGEQLFGRSSVVPELLGALQNGLCRGMIASTIGNNQSKFFESLKAKQRTGFYPKSYWKYTGKQHRRGIDSLVSY